MQIKIDNTAQGKFGIFSFFTGAGFLDLGFEKAGFKSYFASEIDGNFAAVYRYSRKRMRIAEPVFGLKECDVCEYHENAKGKSELSRMMKLAKEDVSLVGFIGGPPCPDFSVANANAQGEDGKRGQLTRVYVDIICEQKPDFFVLENVKGLISTAKHREFFRRMIVQLQNAGYATSHRLINALEYGAAQDRQRVILMGVKRTLCKGHFNRGTNELRDFPWQEFIRFPMDSVAKVKWPGVDGFIEEGKREMPKGVIKELTVQHWFEKNDVENHPNARDFFVPRAGLVKMRLYSEIQVALYEIAKSLDMRTWLAVEDHGIKYNGTPILQHQNIVTDLRDENTIRSFPDAIDVAKHIDCMYFNGGLPFAFEVEHTTGVTSGLTRMLNFRNKAEHLNAHYVIVAPDEDRTLVMQKSQPSQFDDIEPLYFPYSHVEDLYSFISRHGGKMNGVKKDFLLNFMEPCRAA